MKTLDRYLLKSFFTFFLVGQGSIAVIFMVISVLDTLSYYFVSRDAPIRLVALMYFYEEPSLIYMSMPLAVLFSFCITLGLLEQRRELVAIKAAGISLLRLSLPLILSAAVIAFVMYYMGNYLVPAANIKAMETKYFLKYKKPGGYFIGGKYIWYIKDRKTGGFRIHQINRVYTKTNEVKGFRAYEINEDFRLEREIYASFGSYTDKKWVLTDVHGWDYRKEGKIIYRYFDTLELELHEDPRTMASIRYGPEHLTSRKIRRQLRNIDRYGFNELEFLVELRLRQALPFAAIIMALLAVPFGFRPSRSSTLARNLLFAVIIGFAYFAVMGESISLAKNGTLPPAFGVWIANILFGLMGILLFSGTRQ